MSNQRKEAASSIDAAHSTPIPAIQWIALGRRRSGLRPQTMGAGSNGGSKGKIGGPKIRAPRWNMRFGFHGTFETTRSAGQVIARAAEFRNGRSRILPCVMPCRSIRVRGVLGQMQAISIAAHVAGDDAMGHRFCADQFVAIHIGLVFLRIGFRER